MLSNTQFSVDAPRIAFTGEPILDRRGYYRGMVTMSAYRLGKEPPNKSMKLPAEVLTPEEVLALINACGRGRAGRRNRALIMLLWRCGLRISEAIDLMPKDVDLPRGEVRVLHGKRDKMRIVAIDPAAAAILERWELERKDLGVTRQHHYLCVITTPNIGDRMHDTYVRALMKKLAVKAGVEKRVHPHGLRHTYASYLLDNDVPIQHISQMLGHSSIATTVRYLDHINPRKSLEAARAVHWPAVEPLADLSLASSAR